MNELLLFNKTYTPRFIKYLYWLFLVSGLLRALNPIWITLKRFDLIELMQTLIVLAVWFIVARIICEILILLFNLLERKSKET